MHSATTFWRRERARAKKTQVELNNLTISAISKSKLREQFTKISKSILDEQKAAAKADNKRVLDQVTKFFKDDSKKFMVQKVDWSANVQQSNQRRNQDRQRAKVRAERPLHCTSSPHPQMKGKSSMDVMYQKYVLLSLSLTYNPILLF